MFNKDKRSFFERITGSISIDDEEEQDDSIDEQTYSPKIKGAKTWLEEELSTKPIEEEVGELPVDVYQTDNDIIVQAVIAGVRSEDLNISITREMVTIEGHRKKSSEVEGDGYFMKELYWGSFARKILLPCEVEPSEAEAYEKNGLLTLRMPKIDKARTQKVKVRSL